MADAERKLSNGSRIDFATEPQRYKHWKLATEGEVATLTMDVDENAPLFEGYQLKLNSYDLGVDIELADALERLRFEHPEVKVVLLRSGKPRVFCAGANIRMLAGATHAHKVNFCKFTNETRNAIEDASEFSGQKTICVVTGSCAGGGYELALAADHIVLTDDGSSTVSLPELPLLAVLPGTGGLTRVTDKRKVRRDHADVFCTTEEGVKGKRAVEWRLVDEVVPNSKLEDAVKERAREFAAKSDRPADAKGIPLSPLKRTRSADSIEYSAVSVDVSRSDRLATITVRGPDAPPPASVEEMMTQGANFWPLRLARELDDAILDIRINELETAVIVFKSEGDPKLVLEYDAFLAKNARHWLAREVALKWKRVLKRVDLDLALAGDPDRAGLVLCGDARRARVRLRPRLHADRPSGGRQPPAGRDHSWRRQLRRWPADEQRSVSTSNALSRRAGIARCGEKGHWQGARRRSHRTARPRHLRARRHRLGGRDPHVLRGACELLARRAHRHGSQPPLRRAGDDGDENLCAADGLAELDFPAPQRGRRGRRAAPLRHRPEGRVRYETGLEERAMTDDIINVDYREKIPNNVNLTEDRRVLKALEGWHPGYIDWWQNMGPEGFQESLVYLRTAVSVDPKGWAKFDYVKMPEYRWGILLAPHEEGRKVPFGAHMGEDAWQEVPGEYRAMLRRLVVIQGDTEPASVEQQRHLGKTAPSLYDMRNLFQINVEEGRHLWAMVYLLHKYFGRDGRDEADDMLRRRSGSADAPRMLGAFNEATPDWLSLFMFTFFTDRDGKMQLESLAQSGFDPLSRTCRFMLTEEAHHMFVGETGIGRTVQRTCEAMQAAGIDDPNEIEKVRKLGVIDLPTIQKKLNLHYTLSLDLFGSEVSTNAANAFNAGLKGRFRETAIEDDHKLENDIYPVLKFVNGEIKLVDEPALTALNMRLRDDYTRDCAKGIERFNKIIEKTGVNFRLALPHVAFHRDIGEFKDVYATPGGRADRCCDLGEGKGQMAAVDGRRRLHRLADAAGRRAWPVRILDRAAQGRHRQPPGQF